MCEMKTTKFKMTELGPIPVDWEVKRLDEVCSITTGHKDVNQGCKNGKYPFFTCSRNVFAANSYSFDCEAILVAGNGDVGNLHYCKGKFEAYQRTYVLKDFSEEVSYIFHELTYHLMRSLSDGKIGSSIPYITIQQLEGFMLPLPSLPEQRKIAEALSDIDELISALGKLIEKKRNIKTGTMQELLGMRNEESGMRNVPRRRLAGFSGAWVEKRLGEIASFETATIGVDKIDGEWYIGTENMLAEKAGVEKNLTPVPYVTVKEYKVGDVLISNIRPYLKKIWLADRDGGCSTDVLVVRTIDNRICTPMFLKMLLSDDSFFDFTMANAVGTKMPRGDKKVIVNYQVHLPTLAEQKAIAAVLSDMDAEIAALEADRAKYERIKTGMMQELLTGKVRLE